MRRAERGPGNKGRLGARGGPGGPRNQRGPRPRLYTHSPGQPVQPATSPLLPCGPACAPPTAPGRPSAPANRQAPKPGGGACTIGSDVRCSAGRGVSRSSPRRPAEPAEAGAKHGLDLGRREGSGCGGDRSSRGVR